MARAAGEDDWSTYRRPDADDVRPEPERKPRRWLRYRRRRAKLPPLPGGTPPPDTWRAEVGEEWEPPEGGPAGGAVAG